MQLRKDIRRENSNRGGRNQRSGNWQRACRLFRLEYDYINLGTATETIAAGGVTAGGVPYGATVSANVSQSINEVKFGLSYKMPSGFLFW